MGTGAFNLFSFEYCASTKNYDVIVAAPMVLDFETDPCLILVTDLV